MSKVQPSPHLQKQKTMLQPGKPRMNGGTHQDNDEFTPDTLDGLQQHAGYEQVGFGTLTYIAPPSLPAMSSGEPPRMDFGAGGNISADEARGAMLNFVAQHCCFGKDCAQNMSISAIKPSNALRYTLETFCEGRSTGRREVPYRGGAVDGPSNGPPPLPWDIPCSPTANFQDQVVQIPVPHTSEVRICGCCHGHGQVRCENCHGSGHCTCTVCGGRGVYGEKPCTFCGGDGKQKCGSCGGDGQVLCKHCKGARNVVNFIEVTVQYTNHKADFVLEETDMPDELVKQVHGIQLFEQTLPQVWPITAFPVPQINQNSVRLVDSHHTAFPNERQLQQRQILTAIPVTEINYTWKSVVTRFWVFGNEQKVHAPDYPQQCCWGCTVL